MRILGIDPSVRSLGWGMLEYSNQKYHYIASDTAYTNPAEAMSIRLGKLSKKVSQIIEEYLPDIVALETSFLEHDVSAVLKLSYVRGVVMSIVGIKGLKLCEIAPLSVKKAVTGNGRSGKEQVKKMLLQIIAHNGIKFSSYDESDALAIAYTASMIVA